MISIFLFGTMVTCIETGANLVTLWLPVLHKTMPYSIHNN